MLHAIDRERFAVIPIGITRGGTFVLEEDNPAKFQLDAAKLPEVVDNGTRIIWPEGAEDRTLSVREADGSVRELGEVDVVLPILHGVHGEDGTMQGFLDILGLPYAGGGVLGSALGMDKHFMKIALAAAGIAVSPGFTTTAREWAHDADGVRARASQFTLPLFVKPARAGSSVGVSRVADLAEFDDAMQIALAEDTKVLVEQGISGREVEVGVLEGRRGAPARASLPGEVVLTTRAFYDFEGKYLGGDGVDIVCPASMTDDETRTLQEVAVAAFDAVDGLGLARVDFFLTPDGPVVNELNTMPGFTPISMFPKCWIASGMTYADLITELIDTAVERTEG